MHMLPRLLPLLFLAACSGAGDYEGLSIPLRLTLRPDSSGAEQVVRLDTAAAGEELPPYSEARAAFDSVMRLEVKLPPLLDPATAYDTATINTFTRMAARSRGEMKVLVSAALLEDAITRILCQKTTDYADVLFLIDNSGSMADDIAAVREGMGQIISALEDKRGVRLGIAFYRDKQFNGDAWFGFRNFETDYCAAKAYVDSMRLIGNDDTPESVYEAFMAVVQRGDFWRSRRKRVVLIVGDARGKEKADGGEYDVADVMRVASEHAIRVNFFPLIVEPYAERYRANDVGPKPETQTHLIEQVYPNPTTGPVHIRLAREGRYRLGVYSMSGVLVRERYIDGDYWLVDMDGNPDGLYVVRVSDKANQYDVGKFILKRQ